MYNLNEILRNPCRMCYTYCKILAYIFAGNILHAYNLRVGTMKNLFNLASITKAIIISGLSVTLIACGGGGGGGGSAGPTPKPGPKPDPTPHKPIPKPQSDYKIKLSYHNTSEQKDSQRLQASGGGENDIPFKGTGQITATITGQLPKSKTIINLGNTKKLNNGNPVLISIPAGKGSGSTLLTNSNTPTDPPLSDSISITSMTVGGNPVKATYNTLPLTVDGKKPTPKPTPPSSTWPVAFSKIQGVLNSSPIYPSTTGSGPCAPYSVANWSSEHLYGKLTVSSIMTLNGNPASAAAYDFVNNEFVSKAPSPIDLQLSIPAMTITNFCLYGLDKIKDAALPKAYAAMRLFITDTQGQGALIGQTGQKGGLAPLANPDLKTFPYLYGKVEIGNRTIGAVTNTTQVDFVGLPMNIIHSKNRLVFDSYFKSSETDGSAGFSIAQPNSNRTIPQTRSNILTTLAEKLIIESAPIESAQSGIPGIDYNSKDLPYFYTDDQQSLLRIMSPGHRCADQLQATGANPQNSALSYIQTNGMKNIGDLYGGTSCFWLNGSTVDCDGKSMTPEKVRASNKLASAFVFNSINFLDSYKGIPAISANVKSGCAAGENCKTKEYTAYIPLISSTYTGNAATGKDQTAAETSQKPVENVFFTPPTAGEPASKSDYTPSIPLTDNKGNPLYNSILLSSKVASESAKWKVSVGPPASTNSKPFSTIPAPKNGVSNYQISITSPLGNTYKLFAQKTSDGKLSLGPTPISLNGFKKELESPITVSTIKNVVNGNSTKTLVLAGWEDAVQREISFCDIAINSLTHKNIYLKDPASQQYVTLENLLPVDRANLVQALDRLAGMAMNAITRGTIANASYTWGDKSTWYPDENNGPNMWSQAYVRYTLPLGVDGRLYSNPYADMYHAESSLAESTGDWCNTGDNGTSPKDSKCYTDKGITINVLPFGESGGSSTLNIKDAIKANDPSLTPQTCTVGNTAGKGCIVSSAAAAGGGGGGGGGGGASSGNMPFPTQTDPNRTSATISFSVFPSSPSLTCQIDKPSQTISKSKCSGQTPMPLTSGTNTVGYPALPLGSTLTITYGGSEILITHKVKDKLDQLEWSTKSSGEYKLKVEVTPPSPGSKGAGGTLTISPVTTSDQ